MKVKLTIELALPDNITPFTEHLYGVMRQLVHDFYVTRATRTIRDMKVILTAEYDLPDDIGTGDKLRQRMQDTYVNPVASNHYLMLIQKHNDTNTVYEPRDIHQSVTWDFVVGE